MHLAKLIKNRGDDMMKKYIAIGTLLLGIITLGVAFKAKWHNNSNSQGNHANTLQYEDDTEDFYEYEVEGGDTAEIEVKKHDYTNEDESADVAEDFYEYEYEDDDDTAEIEVKRHDYTK